MGEATSQGQSVNTYLFDPESAAEMGRLILQDRLLTEAMGGLFPERSDAEIAKIQRVLDIGCGPGGWALGVAAKYPHIEVIGVDISELMISYARVQAVREDLHNTHFESMNALERLQYPDSSFDLVNARAAVSFVPRTAWPDFVKECARLVRPGGIVRFTEFDMIGLSNSAAFEEVNKGGMEIFHQRGLGFSPTGSSAVGMTFMLGKFLKESGCDNLGLNPRIVDFSYGSKFHEAQTRNVATMFRQAQALFEKMGVAEEQRVEARRMYDRLLAEMQAENFRGVQYWLTAWGEKV